MNFFERPFVRWTGLGIFVALVVASGMYFISGGVSDFGTTFMLAIFVHFLSWFIRVASRWVFKRK